MVEDAAVSRTPGQRGKQAGGDLVRVGGTRAHREMTLE